jgi:hypothetical protein
MIEYGELRVGAPFTEPDRSSTVRKEPYDVEEQASLGGISEYSMVMALAMDDERRADYAK